MYNPFLLVFIDMDNHPGLDLTGQDPSCSSKIISPSENYEEIYNDSGQIFYF